jgi:uncharacterized membrane protein SirB2
MSLFEYLKIFHTACAFFSIGGFALRGFWMLTGNPLLRRRPVRVLPHIVDTLLLASALGMVSLWGFSSLQAGWLMAKIVALLVYIALGMVALRFGKTRLVRITAWLAAMTTAVYMLSVAYSKNPLGFLA